VECIKVKDLLKRYGDIVVLNGISFEVKCSEKWALLGPNAVDPKSPP